MVSLIFLFYVVQYGGIVRNAPYKASSVMEMPNDYPTLITAYFRFKQVHCSRSHVFISTTATIYGVIQQTLQIQKSLILCIHITKRLVKPFLNATV